MEGPGAGIPSRSDEDTCPGGFIGSRAQSVVLITRRGRCGRVSVLVLLVNYHTPRAYQCLLNESYHKVIRADH